MQNIADDIIVHGKSREEHDKNLENCLKRLEQRGLKLNPNKCDFLQNELHFFGQVFLREGIRPDPKRIADLQNVSKPESVQEVRSLLGMANSSCKYIHDFATVTAPLRELTKKDAKFAWTNTQETAFQKIKDALISTHCMAYFDKSKETLVVVDASPVGVSAILSQTTSSTDSEVPKIIAYASRALTDVEKRYSQAEKEALAIVWAVEHFHLYLYGQTFTLVTDHKPLEIIYGSRNSKPSARIERWVLRLQPYTFKVIYKSGAENPADYLSRHPVKHSKHTQEKLAEQYVNFIALNGVPKAMSLQEIVKATNEDKTLQCLRASIKLDRWDNERLKGFKSVKDEISVTSQGIILRGSRIVLPETLKQRAVDLAHETHQGLTKTKALIREKIWFPDIDKLVKNTVDRCIACQATGRPNPPEPLAMTDMPNGPWEMVHIDFKGPLPSGEYLLVVTDRYSRFPEVEIVKSTKASSVIPKLDKVFAVHGIPLTVKSDNGPPFNGDEYDRYFKVLGIDKDLSTPVWPQANAEVERFMQPLTKLLQTARIENRPWKQELNRFLLQYRTTPH